MAAPQDRRLVNDTYLLEAQLGAGAMGSVHSARHVRLNKIFALKLINPSILARGIGRYRFEIEAKSLGRLNHPNIVRVTDYGIDGATETPFLVMEHLQGEALSELIKREGPLPPERALPILQAIAEGLDFAHSQGVLHRDLKPHNVFVARDSAGQSNVKLVDFGLARMSQPADDHLSDNEAGHNDVGGLESTEDQDNGGPTGPEFPVSETAPKNQTVDARTKLGAVMGTAAYMAPEVAEATGATSRSDLYSFGVLAFQMLVGQRPFMGPSVSILRAHVFDDPPKPSSLNPNLPSLIDSALLAALAKKPDQRPESATAYVNGLQAALLSAQRRLWFLRELPRRCSIAVLLTALSLLSAGVSRSWPVIGDLEHRLIDLRFSLTSAVPTHPALAVIYLDDATLDADPLGRPTTAYGEEFGTLLSRAVESGSIGIGLDIEVPGRWSDSQPFFELLTQHSDRVVLAVHSAINETLVGIEVAEGPVTLVLGAERSAALFGYANLTQDRDGTVRRLAYGFLDIDGSWHPTFANRMAGIITSEPATPGSRQDAWVDYRLDWQSIPSWSWMELAGLLEQEPNPLRDRFLLVGGLIEGFGDESYPVPHSANTDSEVAPGVILQALMANTILSDGPPESVPIASWAAATSSVALVLMAVLWFRRLALGLLSVVLFAAGYFGAGLWLFVAVGLVIPMASLLLILPVSTTAAVLIRWLLPDRP